MYTDENRGSLRSTFIKIVLVVAILFVLMILFPTKGFVTNYVDRKLGVSKNGNFNSNLIAMATAGSGYFTESRLPSETSSNVKMTLKEMLDKKMIVPLTDGEGIRCSASKSYVNVTREEDEYTMKVSLTCGGKTDYIMLHMGLDGKQFPSTSTARCKFVKNLDEAWTYGEWSSWGTAKIEESGTVQVETMSKKIKTGDKTVTHDEVESSLSTKYIVNGKDVYYVCGNKYDNAGSYRQQVTCTKKMTVYGTEPVYSWVTYYRSRSKTLNEKTSDIKEASCDDESLINDGYTKVN